MTLHSEIRPSGVKFPAVTTFAPTRKRQFMLKFSTDPDVAEQQMTAIIFYLTAFGYIDGDFDLSEKVFIREYISRHKLIYP